MHGPLSLLLYFTARYDSAETVGNQIDLRPVYRSRVIPAQAGTQFCLPTADIEVDMRKTWIPAKAAGEAGDDGGDSTAYQARNK